MAQFPPADPTQPTGFVTLLQRSLVAAGAQPAAPARLTLGWALRQRDADVVHLHWLEYVVSVDPRPILGLARTVVRATRVISALAVLRMRGVGVVWTVHNLRPHEPKRPRIEYAVAEGVYLLADAVIVHSAYAAARVTERFRGRRGRSPHVIPHPNYIGAFPAGGPAVEELAERLGLVPASYTYLAFGQVRRYKRLSLLAEQFSRLPEPGIRLLIAGRPNDAAEVEVLRSRARADPRIVLWLERIPDELVLALHAACDAAVIAHEDVFSSGAMLLALSCGLPVVAPATGSARELFEGPAVELFDAGGLAQALTRVRARAGSDQRESALRASAAHPWEQAAERTLAVYELARGGK